MFEKVLIANRGEFAVRVMRACEGLGIETVVVYGDVDRNAGHIDYADEAYKVGLARAGDSDLDQEAIIDAAQRAGADAIPPGTASWRRPQSSQSRSRTPTEPLESVPRTRDGASRREYEG